MNYKIKIILGCSKQPIYTNLRIFKSSTYINLELHSFLWNF